MTKTNEPMLKLWGKRNGRLLTKYGSNISINPGRTAVGHIVEMTDKNGRSLQYLECVSFQLDHLEQPSFRNVTREIREWEAAAMADYEATIGDFLMGTGRL